MKLVADFNEKTGEMNITVLCENLKRGNKLAAFIVILTELIENGFEKILKDEKVDKEELDRFYVALEMEIEKLVNERHLSKKEKEKIKTSYILSKLAALFE
ncbi:hypothetical protein [Peptacetobacter sp.]|uniref:hypothetical protein n=1 Tax=Peptacetobacter sp. TaxID=2991975 RepID=UPI00261C2454|nr:hypothetical protein [Peptacetobacter sp.]